MRQPTNSPGSLLRRFLTLTAVFTLIHGIVTITSIGVAFSAGMARFDHPEVRTTFLERICELTANVLMQPAGRVVDAVNVAPRSSLLEWIIVVFNSLVWGAMAALIVCWAIRLKRRHDRTVTAHC
jgi:hypothetical protein